MRFMKSAALAAFAFAPFVLVAIGGEIVYPGAGCILCGLLIYLDART